MRTQRQHVGPPRRRAPQATAAAARGLRFAAGPRVAAAGPRRADRRPASSTAGAASAPAPARRSSRSSVSGSVSRWRSCEAPAATAQLTPGSQPSLPGRRGRARGDAGGRRRRRTRRRRCRWGAPGTVSGGVLGGWRGGVRTGRALPARRAGGASAPNAVRCATSAANASIIVPSRRCSRSPSGGARVRRGSPSAARRARVGRRPRRGPRAGPS